MDAAQRIYLTTDRDGFTHVLVNYRATEVSEIYGLISELDRLHIPSFVVLMPEMLGLNWGQRMPSACCWQSHVDALGMVHWHHPTWRGLPCFAFGLADHLGASLRQGLRNISELQALGLSQRAD